MPGPEASPPDPRLPAKPAQTGESRAPTGLRLTSVTSASTPLHCDPPPHSAAYRLLGSSPDAALDDLLKLALTLSGCTLGAISLVDKAGAWLKATAGEQATLLAQDPAFCAQAAALNTPLAAQAMNDPRLANSPLVTGAPHVRSYIGLPIADATGVIGALCLLHADALSIPPALQDTLAALARQAGHLLQARLAEHQALASKVLARGSASDERFRTIFELSAMGIAEVDPAGRWRLVNQRLCDMLGYSAEELYAGDFQSITHPEDLPGNLAVVQDLASGTRTSAIMEKRYLRRDGSILWVRMAVAVVRPEESADCYFISVIEDITAQKQSEMRLRESAILYRRMFADSPQPMWVGDRETRMFIDVNAAAIAHYGYTREEFLSFHLVDIRAPERRNDPLQALVAPEEGEFVRTYPRRHRRKNGTEIDTMISVQWIDYNGRPAIVVVVNDVTAIVQAEQRMRRVNAELEQRVAERTAKLEIANKELADFSYSVAHDLRSPLRSMHGFGMLLMENEAPCMSEEGRDHLRRIVRSSELMAELIDDLLEYARVEREPLAAGAIDVRELCLEVVESRLEDNAAEHVSITVDVPAGQVLASRRALIVALRNLLDNAVKFSRGKTQPRVEIGGTLADGTWTLWVRDNGIGFDMTYHDKIFDMFQRLHRADAYTGTGIGLALVRKAVQRMGGSVWAYSTPGVGATFYLRLPAA